ncbi:MAG: hypothetical protein HQL43_04175 [Alphaproteobacteria bacterium]|nr:hypothetical protein [Alphaproteobacteria bacterium]
MLRESIIRSFLIGLGAFAVSSTSFAQELNQRQDIDSRTGAKIMRMQAETMRQGNQNNTQKPLTKPAECGVNVGNVTTTQGGNTPKEVTTVITGDVISVCK